MHYFILLSSLVFGYVVTAHAQDGIRPSTPLDVDAIHHPDRSNPTQGMMGTVNQDGRHAVVDQQAGSMRSKFSALGTGAWLAGFHQPGFNNSVYDLNATSDGTIYAAGGFTIAGSTVADHIAAWNGSSWSPLGLGLNALVNGIAVRDDTVYAAGMFTEAGGAPANRIAKWDGSSWSTFGSGLNQLAYAIAFYHGEMYVGGGFTEAGGNPANRIAKWNGSSWQPLSTGTDGVVWALAVYDDTLFVGGDFSNVGGMSSENIAKWDGVAWDSVAGGMNAPIWTFLAGGDGLYAGGPFTMAGSTPASNVAKWNGTSWDALGAGISTGSGVLDLAMKGDTLYAGGLFAQAGGNPAMNVARWDGSSWSNLGTGVGAAARTLLVRSDTLYVGGLFSTVGGVPANRIAKWHDTAWHTVGTGNGIGGTYAQVDALVEVGGILYAGGSFPSAGDLLVNGIAAWDGSDWDSLGSGISGPNPWVRDLAYHDGSLYAVGSFTSAGGTPANNIARWNGASWSALGSGLGSDAFAIAFKGDTLFAGGFFTAAGGSPAGYIAKWDGADWHPVGGGFNGPVLDLIVRDDSVYATGSFSTADGNPANNVAKWNGTSWSPLGGGIGSLGMYGFSLAFGGDILFAGGDFSEYIMQWNGSSWSTLGDGPFGFIEAMVYCGGELIVGGNFLADPSKNIPRGLAKWDGVAWDSVGSGIDGNVYSLALGSLYVGGNFALAGDVPSANIAVDPSVSCAELPVELLSFGAVAHAESVVLSWRTASERDNAGFSIEEERAGTFEELAFVPGAGTSNVPTSYSYRVTSPGAGIHRYRLKQLDFDGSFQYSAVVEVTVEVPGTHALTAVWPNPFSDRAETSLAVSRSQQVTVSVFDALGRRVVGLFDGPLDAHRAKRIEIDTGGLSSGTYLLRVEGETFTETRLIIIAH